MAATLTSDMKADLGKGSGHVLIVPTFTTLTDTTFDDPDELFTTNGTLAISEAEPTKTTIKLDQGGGEVVTNLYENGDTTIKGTIPFVAGAVYKYFYTQLEGTDVPISTSTVKIHGYTFNVNGCFTLSKKISNVAMYLESESKNTAVIFTNCELYAVMDTKTVNTALQSFNFTATPVLGGTFINLSGGVKTT